MMTIDVMIMIVIGWFTIIRIVVVVDVMVGIY